MLVPPPAVTVTLDGAIVAAGAEAALVRGTVVAPLAPFVEAIATRVVVADGETTIEARGRRLRLRAGDRVARFTDARGEAVALAVAPAVRGGRLYVPLAALARALGYRARFEGSGANRVLALFRPPAVSIEAAPAETSPPGPYVTLEPRTVATPPRPAAPVDPRPRRTPIEEIDGR